MNIYVAQSDTKKNGLCPTLVPRKGKNQKRKEKKIMKKNKVLRLASVLMMACLLTTCVISGTFAKYVSTKSAQDKARVAYWGFKGATLEINDLFANAYDNTDGEATVKSTQIDPDTNEEVDVIAPGTEGSVTIQYKYVENGSITAPEVAYKFEVSTAGSSCANEIKVNENITWALVPGSTAPAADATEWGTWDALLTKIAGLSVERVEAGELPALSKGAYTIAWKWAFKEDGASNAKDTDMSESLAEVKLIITVTATQID